MKKIMIIAMMMTIAISANAMSYNEAQNEALFLSDKMAYELGLTEEQYEAVYEINLDYLLSISNKSSLYSTYWDRRNTDLRYVLGTYLYNKYIALKYFYRPVYWHSSAFRFRIYKRYTNHYTYYRPRPVVYTSYRGGNNRIHNSVYANRNFTRNNNTGTIHNNVSNGNNSTHFGNLGNNTPSRNNNSTIKNNNNRTFGNSNKTNNKVTNSSNANGNRTFGNSNKTTTNNNKVTNSSNTNRNNGNGSRTFGTSNKTTTNNNKVTNSSNTNRNNGNGSRNFGTSSTRGNSSNNSSSKTTSSGHFGGAK